MHTTLIAIAITLAAGVVPASAQRSLTDDTRTHVMSFGESLRTILVCLPPGYEADKSRRYPTLYMHDGANVYVEWQIDEIANALIKAGKIEPLIIVLVPNGGTSEDRFNDYTPTKPLQARAGGKADAYGTWLMEEVKPLIDKTYRTLPDAANTGLGGASLGGLISVYFGLRYPSAFGKLAVLSPSVWWDGKLILREVKNVKERPNTRIWLDVGTRESRDAIPDTRQLRDALVKKGWAIGQDLSYSEIDGATHDEASFARRAGALLVFLYPPKPGV